MSSPDPTQRVPVTGYSFRSCITIVAVVFILVSALLFAARTYMQDPVERDRVERLHTEFDRIKAGGHSAYVFDSRLLPLLAGDADCLKNLTSLYFSMFDVRERDIKSIALMSNVREITLYGTDGAEHVIVHALELPIETVNLEQITLPKRSLRLLTHFPNLKVVAFDHVLDDAEFEFANALPETILVHCPAESEGRMTRKNVEAP